MARITGPKDRISRREGVELFGVAWKDPARLLLRALLMGHTRSGVMAEFKKEYEAADVERRQQGIDGLARALREETVFGIWLREREKAQALSV